MTVAVELTMTDGELGRVRSRLELLADARLLEPLTDAEDALYQQLCGRELQLLGVAWTG